MEQGPGLLWDPVDLGIGTCQWLRCGARPCLTVKCEAAGCIWGALQLLLISPRQNATSPHFWSTKQNNKQISEHICKACCGSTRLRRTGKKQTMLFVFRYKITMRKLSDRFLKVIIFTVTLWAAELLCCILSLVSIWKSLHLSESNHNCIFNLLLCLFYLPGFCSPECFCWMEVRPEILHTMAPWHSHTFPSPDSRHAQARSLVHPGSPLRTRLAEVLPISLSKGRNGTSKALKHGELTSGPEAQAFSVRTLWF